MNDAALGWTFRNSEASLNSAGKSLTITFSATPHPKLYTQFLNDACQLHRYLE
jgi:hypothetical protein